MSNVSLLHDAVKRGDLLAIRGLLEQDRMLANMPSESDGRGTYPLHVAAESNQPEAARVLIEFGADVSLRDRENDANALGWAAFFGRPELVSVLLSAGSDPNQKNSNGLTPLGCAMSGTQGRWERFSNATVAEWQRAADAIRASGGVE